LLIEFISYKLINIKSVLIFHKLWITESVDSRSLLADTFSDLHGAHLKSSSQPFAAFQKSSMQTWEKCQVKGKKELKFKR
jgi:hypothetical protein